MRFDAMAFRDWCFAHENRSTVRTQQAELALDIGLLEFGGRQSGMAIGAVDSNHGEAPRFQIL